jgi:hypothetical protein
MNRWLYIGLGAVAMLAAVALYFGGQKLPAAIALGISVMFDMLFALASRGANSEKKIQ